MLKKGKYGSNIVLIVCATVLVVSIIFACFGGARIHRGKKFVKEGKRASAHIVNFKTDEKGRPCVNFYYTADENYYYVDRYDLNGNSHYIGEEINTYYFEGEPETIFIKNSAFEICSFYCGLAFIAISIIVCAWYYLPKMYRQNIIEKGSWEMCKVVKVEKAVFGRKRVYCSSKGFPKRKGRPFVSKTVRFELPKGIKSTSLTVYYLENNPNFYFVDIDKVNYKD